MIVLDANVIIGHLEAGNALHRRASALIRQAIKNDEHFAVHPLTLGEVLVGAVRNGIEEQTLRAVTDDLEVEILNDFPAEWPLDIARTRAATGLRMPDAVVFEAAIRKGALIATFDRQLAAAAKTAGILYGEAPTPLAEP